MQEKQSHFPLFSPCDWKTAPLGNLQGLPKDAKPIAI